MVFKTLQTIFSVKLKLLLSHKTGKPKKPVTKNKIAKMRNLAVFRSPSLSKLLLVSVGPVGWPLGREPDGGGDGR
jgi:hypothetical protein